MKPSLRKNIEMKKALAEVDRLTSENLKLKNRSLIDEGMDAIFHLEQVIKHIDKRLIFGSILFVIGWGLGGFCSGPAEAKLSYSFFTVIFFFDSYVDGFIN